MSVLFRIKHPATGRYLVPVSDSFDAQGLIALRGVLPDDPQFSEAAIVWTEPVHRSRPAGGEMGGRMINVSTGGVLHQRPGGRVQLTSDADGTEDLFQFRNVEEKPDLSRSLTFRNMWTGLNPDGDFIRLAGDTPEHASPADVNPTTEEVDFMWALEFI